MHPIKPAIIYCEANFGEIDGKTANGLVRSSERYKILSVIDSTKAGLDAGMVLDNKANGIPIFRNLAESLAHAKALPDYFIFGMAQMAFLENDYETAQEHVSEAISLNDQEHRFYFLQGAIYEKTGMPKLASDNFNKALELSGDKKQQARYRSKMHRLAAAKS